MAGLNLPSYLKGDKLKEIESEEPKKEDDKK